MSHTFSKKLFSDSKVGFMTSGEKSNNHFAQSQASAMGLGFNRSMQHLKFCMSRRSVADETKTSDLLL
jgi:hypothetical protein